MRLTDTSPDDLDLFYISTVFEVCDDGRGNLAISRLLAKKNCTFFAIYYVFMYGVYALRAAAPIVRVACGCPDS